MEVLFVLFAVALVWLYFWAKRLDAQEKKRQQRVWNLYEDQKKVDESLLSGNSISSTHNARIKTREESSQKQNSAPSETGERPTYLSQQHQAINETSEQSKESLNTGIPELDGPGMFHRLLALALSVRRIPPLLQKAQCL